jgi:hypothetical protein
MMKNPRLKQQGLEKLDSEEWPYPNICHDPSLHTNSALKNTCGRIKFCWEKNLLFDG